MLKKYIAGIAAALLMLAPMAAAAQTAISTEGLSEQQIAELNLRAAELKSAVPEKTTAAKVNEWVEVGEGIGAGLASAARETGTVVNEFATTPVGKIVTVAIIWKVMGKDLLGIFIGIPMLITVITIALWMTRAVLHVPMIKHYEGGKIVRKEPSPNYSNTLSEGDVLILILAFLIGVIGSIWIIAGVIL